MKKTLVVLLAAALFGVAAAAQTKKEEPKPAAKPAAKADTKGAKAEPKLELKTDQEKLAYSLGSDIGARLKDLKTDLDMKVFVRGVEDKMKDREPAISADEQTSIKKAFFDKKKEEAQAETKALAEKNRRDGETFLADNRNKPGVQVTASGLQYQVLQEGTGEIPKSTDKVTVQYKGTLLDGTEFDSSYKRGQPASFPVSGVIKGWTEGLQLMKVGSKYKFFIPAALAYAERGAGKDIGPNSALIFEVELVAIEPPAPAPAAAPAGAAPSIQMKPAPAGQQPPATPPPPPPAAGGQPVK
jgi:FKBP-type peptidyl-prolyl cis-trans isomerase FkpA/FKBP-type peptidyl-prolyl cis-trans isomerase FklB